jgi:hypothetical protein
VLLVGIGATAIYLLGQQDGETPKRPATQASSEPSPIGEPSATGEPAPTEPAAEVSTNTLFVKVGQCVKDEGTSGKPELVITECGAKTYEVLARFDGVTSGGNDAKTKCAKITGYTNWYFFNSELDTLDFVLCLKNR